MVRKLHGLTLVELLTVLGIIGLLAGLIIPSLVTARAAANRARTRVQFNSWTAAIEAFRSEYGCYPQFAPTALVNDGAVAGPGGDHLFHDVLAGRHRDGSPLGPAGTGTAASAQNPKLISFHTFAESEFNAAGLLQDAFGATEIVVLVDADLDGSVKPGTDFAALPAVHAADGSVITPSPADFPSGGVKAGVVFYGPDPRATAVNPLFIFSWK